MSDQHSNQDQFYIGWQDKAPTSYAKLSRRFIMVVALVMVMVATLLVVSQKGFVGSTFELGQSTTLEGVLVKEPVPMLKVKTGVGSQGKSIFESVLLIGFGKFGAAPTIALIEDKAEQSLDGKTIKLTGTLIYYNGKQAFELTDGVEAYQGISMNVLGYEAQRKSFGGVSLRGEILDPKCALGVMKPGYGKPHRSCAIRCLSGGIPPVMRMKSKDGSENYCVVVGQNGQPINEQLLPYVADQVQLCGQLEQQDDWLVLYTDPENDLTRLKPYWMDGDIPLCN